MGSNEEEEDDRKHLNDSSSQRDRHKKTRDRGYETFDDTNIVAAGYAD
jgi:hypothetical protein